MGAFKYFFLVYFRIFLPLVLLGVTMIRFSLTSFVYLVCLMITPLLQIPSKRTMKGSTGLFLRSFFIISLLPTLGHIVFQLIMWSIIDSEGYFGNFTSCGNAEKLMRQIGYQSLKGVSLWNMVHLILPDVLAFFLSVLTMALSVKMSNYQAGTTAITSETPLLGGEKVHHKCYAVQVFLEYLQNSTLLAAGIIAPSVLGGVYFISVLCFLTMWGCFRSVGAHYLLVQVLLLLFTGCHILLLYLYQLQAFQEFLPPASLLARILGLHGIVQTKCTDLSRLTFYPDIKWPTLVNPVVLLVLYWIGAININIWLHWPKDVEDESQPSPKHNAGKESFVSFQTRSGKDHDSEASGLVFMEVEEEESTESSHTVVIMDRTAQKPKGAMKRMPWMSVAFVIMKHSHVVTLMAIMAWSITYHSLLTFVFLLVACLLWLMPNTRTACLWISPLLVLYAEFLLVSQYLFCLDFDLESVTSENTHNLKEIGFQKFDNALPNFTLQTVYSCFIFLTFRQHCYERQVVIPKRILLKSRKSLINRLLPLGMEYSTYDSSTMIALGNFVWHLLCKYWIFFCAILMAMVSVQDVVIFRIIYMVLFLIFIVTFNLSFEAWRSINYIFWWVVALYSILVLILIYTYQFEDAQFYWKNMTGFNDEVLKDIGLHKYDITGLFINLLTPTCFLVIVIMQLRYFHETFMDISSLTRYSDADENFNKSKSDVTLNRRSRKLTFSNGEEYHFKGTTSMQNWLRRESLKMSTMWSKLNAYLWRLAQIHIGKVVSFTVIVVAVNEVFALTAVYVFLVAALLSIPHTGKVLSTLLPWIPHHSAGDMMVSALTAVYVFLLAVLMPIPRSGKLLSTLLLLWTAVIILIKMAFELKIADNDFWSATCHVGNKSIHVNFLDNAAWFGFKKYEPEKMSFGRYLWMYMWILATIMFESIIRYHQKQYYANPLAGKPYKGILFPHITRMDADRSVVHCIKFFANYFFYKFGLECCYIVTAIVVSIRVDIVAFVYIMIVGLLLTLTRHRVARLWPFYKLTLSIFLAIQFLLVLGFPYSTCISYPWSDDIEIPSNLRQWLYLPGYFDPPKSNKLIVDFVQLLCVCLQGSVFKIESNYQSVEEFGGGDNADILYEVEMHLSIPYRDFTLEQKSAIETIMVNVFEHMFWVTMAIVFITGATRINIFSFLYVAAVFYFMWYGKEFYVKPLRELLRMWNYLIGYSVLVMIMKTLLQLVGCVYAMSLINNNQCWVVQLFGVQCLLATSNLVLNSSCVVEHDNAGLAWDVVCLTFLLMQRRIYSSHYFRHTVETIHAQNNLVAKGAEIINRILIRDVLRRNEEEHQLLMNIKQQMRELKTKQAMLKKDYQEPEEHFQAIRSGDYYLLEFDQDETQKPTDQPETETNAENPLTDVQSSKNISTPVDLDNIDYFTRTASRTSSEKTESSEIDAAYRFSSGFGILNEMYFQFLDMASASTSKLKAEETELEPDTVNKIRIALGVLNALWLRFIDWLIDWMNKLSYNYRLVAKKLAKELIIEKQKILIFKRNRRSGEPFKLKELLATLENLDVAPEILLKSHLDSYSVLSLDQLEKEDAEEMKQQFIDNNQRFNRLMVSGGLVLASHSQLLCYFLMILDQMIYGSLLSLPLPLMVFLWGMLSVPRPSKTFWVTVITYTESVVVCKYFYQFGFFPWNSALVRESPFFPPRIIGIEKTSHYASVDIALLLALFLHRSILRKYGLWRDSADISADMAAAGNKEHPLLGTWGRSSDDSDYNEFEDDSYEVTRASSRFWLGMYSVVNPFAKFFHEVTHSHYSATTDVYTAMFFCDLVLFLVLVFGFSSFGPVDTTGTQNVASYLRESKIPIPFVIMLITQFIFILIDRAIFLRKFVLGKYIFQIVLVITVHIWMFFVLPAITRRSFFNNIAAQTWYLFKCIYFALSAHQIRCGYPVRTIGNILTKSYSFANLLLYKGFLAIPFLLELRALMDWTWSDSTLALGNWLQMEDIYANIFVIKCWREIEKKFPQQRAVKKDTCVKYLLGGLLLFIIIIIVWFPLLFFSFLHTVYISNPPIEASMSIAVGQYPPLFIATATTESIRPLTDNEFNLLKAHFSRDRNTFSFLSNFEPSDVTLTEFDGKSLSIWGISPIGQHDLMFELRKGMSKKLSLSVKMKFIREASKSETGETRGTFELKLHEPSEINKNVATVMANVIEGVFNLSVNIYGVFPRYLRLTDRPSVIVMDDMVEGRFGVGYSNISLLLHSLSLEEISKSWSLSEMLQGPTVFHYNRNSNPNVVRKASVITFNERKAPPALSFLSGLSIFTGGVIVMYVSFVLVVFKFIRVSFVSGRTLHIHLEEAPDVDYLLQTIDDMYLAREMKDFWLEEEIFAKLLFILRCPDVLFYVTRTRNIVRINPHEQRRSSKMEYIHEKRPSVSHRTESHFRANRMSKYVTLPPK